MPCPRSETTERPETRAERGPSGATIKKSARETARLRLQRAAQADQLSPALIREAQASLASALSLSDLLLGRRA
jgi:hypothetical protein